MNSVMRKTQAKIARLHSHWQRAKNHIRYTKYERGRGGNSATN